MSSKSRVVRYATPCAAHAPLICIVSPYPRGRAAITVTVHLSYPIINVICKRDALTPTSISAMTGEWMASQDGTEWTYDKKKAE